MLKENQERIAWFDNPTERMKHTGQAIRDAAEKGGYGYRWWKANDIEHNEGYNALPMRSLTEHLNDPNFWKALQKARSWQDFRRVALSLAPICGSHRFRQRR